ncbi:MAG TPA: Na+/H+ antiporter NhaA [Acidimicrobiales bacterium]|jgi:NhaA family Na+:H+ antiporter|nr:Na+/H+ antiporter NhaA [Acidimicrobiales bacterium]
MSRRIDALREFLATEQAGGVVLLLATIAALVWANSVWQHGYESLWSTDAAGLTLHEWVNDALMAVFFLVAGLEIKRELVAGELREPRRAAVPALAALGGMVVPALLYVAVTRSGHDLDGWAIPMATDIAFALGVLALVGDRVPSSLRLFLLTLAIVDDLGAIAVIAVFYSEGIDGAALGGAIAVVVVLVLLTRAGVRQWWMLGPLAIALWALVHASGVHATIAGVAFGLLMPVDAIERLEGRLHPFTSFVVVPLFALANAGVHLTGDILRDASTSPITIGVVVGLVAGKVIGITGATWIASRAGLGGLPDDVEWRAFVGMTMVAGIGFTVSLFVTELAFGAGVLADRARIGVLAASAIAGTLGVLVLRYSTPAGRAQRSNGD